MPIQKDDDFDCLLKQPVQLGSGGESGELMNPAETTCDTCEHFTPVAPFSESLGSCGLPDPSKINWIQDGYVAGVHVGTNLGCAHWEKKR